MRGRLRELVTACLGVLSVIVQSAIAAPPVSWRDDALLHDVCCVSQSLAFAVGEHGVIWKSEDGGRKWFPLDCGFDVTLNSVCFLTNQIGWVAGCDPSPYSNLDRGVLLATEDGGRTWKRLGQAPLPELSYVRFFDLEEGIIVGLPNSASPSGIFKTSDGGKTWRGVQGETSHPWKAGCFMSSESGVVAGVNGQVTLMGGDELFSSKLPPRGLRSIRAIQLSEEGVGWLAGDGGLVLKSTNEGIGWTAPTTELPDEVRDLMDFRAIDVRGQNVWIAGSPGSVIWQSADGGKHWTKQATGQTVPLSAIRFSNEQHGIAVGALGVILRTENGGRTWQAIHGDGRRSALLSLHARMSQTAAPLLVKLSGEAGYRSAVWVAERNDLGPLAASTDGETRLKAAIQRCGGNASEFMWQLPVTVPGVEHSTTHLMAEWQKQTEGRLPQTLLGTIVRQIRTWRPSVIVVDQPAPDDAASRLVFDTVQQAIKQAADSEQCAEQSDFAGLTAWKVERVYMRLPPGTIGDAQVVLDDYLPYLKSSARVLAKLSNEMLQYPRIPQANTTEEARISYRLVNRMGKIGSPSVEIRASDFFAGLAIEPGSSARRELGTVDEVALEKMEKLLQKQRNFTAYSQRSLDDPRVSKQLLGQLRTVVDGMEPAQAAGILHDLADEYRKRSQFEMVESTYQELIMRYPQEPASVDAMRWLIQFWCSGETTWQRLRAVKSQVAVSQSNPVQTAQFVQQGDGQTLLNEDGVNAKIGGLGQNDVLSATQAGNPVRFEAKLDLDPQPQPGKKNKKAGEQLTLTAATDSRSSAFSEWQQRAVELAKRLEATSPALYRSPEIQFPLASLRRIKGSETMANSIVRNMAAHSSNAETKKLAARDLWASFPTIEVPEAMIECRRAVRRPHLDGVLTDGCWESAKELKLTEKPASAAELGGSPEQSVALVLLAYDKQFLYLACNVPRLADAPTDLPRAAGRRHDADLTRHDRITIRLDIDRDYATWYEFQVDQRGWTTESCWEDSRWNPQWFVAADADQNEWRVEVAIPWQELSPVPPKTGTIYGLSVLRTTPAVGLQSWTHPASTQPRLASFGLLKFE